VRQAVWCALLATVLAALAGCGGGGGEKKGETEQPSAAAKSACNGAALADSEKLKLPPSFPQIENVTYTMQSTEGPTDVVEGYFTGSVEDAHDEYKKELEGAGYKVLFDELEEHDSEISWKGEGRTGQVALREQCAENDKVYIHITNRPA
jgi:hypothetical protein